VVTELLGALSSSSSRGHHRRRLRLLFGRRLDPARSHTPAILSRSLPLGRPFIRIGDALLLRQLERRFLHQDSLAPVALAGAAPLQDQRSKLRVLGRPGVLGRCRFVADTRGGRGPSTRPSAQEGVSRSELIRRASLALIEATKIRKLEKRLVDAYTRVPQDPVLVETARRLAAETTPNW